MEETDQNFAIFFIALTTSKRDMKKDESIFQNIKISLVFLSSLM